MQYSQHLTNPRQTPQSQPIPGREAGMTPNRAGGHVFQSTDLQTLRRFLVLGTEGGTFYASEKELSKEAIKHIQSAVKTHGRAVVDMIVEISDGGKAVKNDPAILALALCASADDPVTRKSALEALNAVCRTGMHLFTFAEYVNTQRGWGRGLRQAVGGWYQHKGVNALPYQLIKYRQRGGWTHRDLLRLAHPNPGSHGWLDVSMDNLFKWVVGKPWEYELIPDLIKGYALACTCESGAEMVAIINKFKLPWEAVPTQFLKSAQVWKALLPDLPLTALTRNLGRLTSLGVLKPFSEELAIVQAKLDDANYITKSRLHPMSILIALKQYERGQGDKGSLVWGPISQVVEALDKAFYMAFGNVEPTGQNLMLAIDASNSMTSDVAGVNGLSCRQAAIAQALVTAVVEPSVYIIGFTEGQHVFALPISSRDSLTGAMSKLEMYTKGNGTDCALPALTAARLELNVDAIVMYSDQETWAGHTHPAQALDALRHKLNKPVKLANLAMAYNGYTLSDTSDPNSMDFVGFDTSTPQAVSSFLTSL